MSSFSESAPKLNAFLAASGATRPRARAFSKNLTNATLASLPTTLNWGLWPYNTFAKSAYWPANFAAATVGQTGLGHFADFPNTSVELGPQTSQPHSRLLRNFSAYPT